MSALNDSTSQAASDHRHSLLDGEVPEKDTNTSNTTDSIPIPLSSANEQKKAQIHDAALRRDLGSLIDLATSSGGLLDDNLRCIAWPVLLGVTTTDKEGSQQLDLSTVIHRDQEQVQKDVDRSFVHYPSSPTPSQLAQRRTQLSDLILNVLCRHTELCYFQGYHDIVQVLLLVLGPGNVAIQAVEKLSLLRIRDFMLPTMGAAMTHLNLIPAILYAVDKELYRHLLPTNPFYALSATLTLYAHNIDAYSDIARLFDFLLASDATTPIYFFVATILARREELLDIDATYEPEILQFTIQKLPSPLDLEGLIRETVALQKQHPPEHLAFGAWKKVSKYSVLKTTRDPKRLQSSTLKEGEEFFRRHAAEVHRQEAIVASIRKIKQVIRVNRRPAMVLAVTVAVAFAAYILRDNGGLSAAQPFFGRYLEPVLRKLNGLKLLGLR